MASKPVARTTRKKKDPGILNITNPNLLTEPVLAEHFVALAATCKFLGKTFEEGEKICYRGDEWQCGDGSWHKTGETC